MGTIVLRYVSKNLLRNYVCVDNSLSLNAKAVLSGSILFEVQLFCKCKYSCLFTFLALCLDPINSICIDFEYREVNLEYIYVFAHKLDVN